MGVQRQASAARDKRSGVALLMSALLCLALMPMVGLVIDGVTTYIMRSEVSSALDSSVVAGARSLNLGQDIASQLTSATSMSQRVFNANVSAMNWRMLHVTAAISVGQNDVSHYRWVTATANADVPLVMMGMLGFPTAHIHMTATAQRRDVNVVLVLDHSGSMANAMVATRTAATDFTNMFAGGRDKLGLVVFTGSTFVAYHPSVNFKSDPVNVTSLIGQLQSNNGATNTAQAMWNAYGELRTLNQPGALNVIVLFTDGLANTYTADFTSLISRTASGCTGLAHPLAGVILAFTGGNLTSGISDPAAQSLNDVTEGRAAPNSAGCFWNSDTLNTGQSLTTALTGLPAVDINGNSTKGSVTRAPYLPVNLTAGGISNSASANINVTNSGQNAFDDAANRIRSDASLKPLIYAVGLGGNPGAPPDNVLMARVANDPASPSFNSGQGAGLYVFSPSTSQLHDAFLRIASQILALTQ